MEKLKESIIKPIFQEIEGGFKKGEFLKYIKFERVKK